MTINYIEKFYGADSEFLFQFHQKEDEFKLQSREKNISTHPSTEKLTEQWEMVQERLHTSNNRLHNKQRLTAWERNDNHTSKKIRNLLKKLPDFTHVELRHSRKGTSWATMLGKEHPTYLKQVRDNILILYNTETKKVHYKPLPNHRAHSRKLNKKQANRKVRYLPDTEKVGNYRKYHDMLAAK